MASGCVLGAMTPNKPVRIIAYVVAAVMLLMGGMKLMNPAMSGAQFEGWGYPAWFALVTGALEMAAGVLLFVGRTRFFGAALTGVVMLGAIVTHLRMPEMGMIPLAAMILAGAAFVAWQLRSALRQAAPVVV